MTFDLTHKASPPEWLTRLFPSARDASNRADAPLWHAFDQLGIQERYDNLIASVCYEHIEAHILETCQEEWDKPWLQLTRDWMTEEIVPWMVLPYARGARNSTSLIQYVGNIYIHQEVSAAEEVQKMLQGIGSRLDFHVCKTLAELR